MKNKFGKKSIIQLTSLLKDDEAILSDVYYTAPFKIMIPFKITKNTLNVMILSVSAGIMEGDEQDILIEVGEGTNLEVTSQAYEKIHKMQGGFAKRETKIKVKKNSSLIYNPLPTIPFKDSSFINKVNIDLEDSSSKLIFIDILSSGRVASGESFEYSSYINLVEIRENNKLIYRDNCRYEPNNIDMNVLGLYEEFTHCATMVICNYNLSNNQFDNIREYIDKDFDSINNENRAKVIGGITYSTGGNIVIKLLGKSSEILIQKCELFRKIILK